MLFQPMVAPGLFATVCTMGFQYCIRYMSRCSVAHLPAACRFLLRRWCPLIIFGAGIFSTLPNTVALPWQRASGYNLRARAETAMARYKQVVGDGLRSHTDGRRATEVNVAAHVLNCMLWLGRPNSVRIV